MNPGKILKTLKHAFEYIAVVSALFLAKFIPDKIRPILAVVVGKTAYLCTPRRVRIADENLSRAFPTMTDAERKKITKLVYRNLAANFVDYGNPGIAVDKIVLSADDQKRLAEIRSLHSNGQPFIFALAHYGNWEALILYLFRLFPGLNGLAKEQSNPFVNKAIHDLRLSAQKHFGTGGSIVFSRDAARSLPKLFKKGESCGMVADQDGGSEGLMIDFLGRPTSYFRGLGLFSAHFDIPVVVVLLKRNKNNFSLQVSDFIKPRKDVDKNSEMKRIITAYSDFLGEAVKKDPEQWLWTHRRWKSSPPRLD
jgi:KDO2-lipid IV(A) lauroyltransferase